MKIALFRPTTPKTAFLSFLHFQVGGLNLLMVAAETGAHKIAKELIERAVDVNYQDSVRLAHETEIILSFFGGC